MNLKSSLNHVSETTTPEEGAERVRKIRTEALRLGFDACGIASADAVSDASFLREWLDAGYAAGMQYMHNHFEKRTDPRLLVEGARSVIVVALNYYPSVMRDPAYPAFAYYAYGKDYHDVVKEKLRELHAFIEREIGPANGRMFTDSAPVLERYWAVRAGLGFIGKNSNLILPGKGSYFFIGELILDLELPADTPLKRSCGTCTRCMDQCPSRAIKRPGVVDSGRCISYQTIEQKGEIDPAIAGCLSGKVYGCDVCQQVCPWNRFATPNTTPEFLPSEAFLALDRERLEQLTEEEFRILFKGSAVKRAGFKGLKRNFAAMLQAESGENFGK